MNKAIRPEHLKQLRPLEAELKQAVKLQEPQAAEAAMKAIQVLLTPYGSNQPFQGWENHIDVYPA
jgi:hypothetical protein